MKSSRIVGTVVLLMFAMVMMTGCGTSSKQVEPDAVGLKYSQGRYGGKKFKNVIPPGGTDTYFNDEVFQIPISQRSYIVRHAKADEDIKPDVDGVISVPSSDGTLIDFEVSVAFALNTRTDDIPGYEGGTARKFYEQLCRHYSCDLNDKGKTPKGFRQLEREKFYPQLESAFKDEARKYTGDNIVNNAEGTLTNLQTAVGKTFRKYLKAQTGEDYFCGPSFDRTLKIDSSTDEEKVCPPVQLLIISADYNNPAVRQSRENKKVATDVNTAQEKVKQSISDPNYLKYLEIQAMNKCAENAKAVCVFGGNTGDAALARP